MLTVQNTGIRCLTAASCAVASFTMAIAITAPPTIAQTPNADPNYRTIDLNSGFTPDPVVINVLSGGGINANRISPNCAGFISDRPDIRLFYNAGTYPLIFSADSFADTTLVVNAPDGSWYCNDDGGQGYNPSIRFNRPLSGRYEIWIGTYGTDTLEDADLHISELYSQ